MADQRTAEAVRDASGPGAVVIEACADELVATGGFRVTAP